MNFKMIYIFKENNNYTDKLAHLNVNNMIELSLYFS